MATIGNEDLTLLDWAKRLDPDGKTASIVEILAQTNAILEDMSWLEGNLPTGHRTTVRTGLPQAAWRKLNQGVPKSKSRTAQIDEATGMLEAYSEVDVDLAKLNGNTAAFRFSESTAFMEGMSQQMAETLFYGNNIGGAEFVGLAPRFATAAPAASPNAVNVIDGGGTGSDNASIWLCVWGPQTVHGIFPKGSMAGLQHRDLGEDTVSDADGNQFQAYRDHYQWKAGIALRDWRYVVRIANVDVSDLSTGSAADLITLMIKAIHRVPNLRAGRPCFYANRTISQYLDIQALNKANVQLSMREYEGHFITSFRGIPIKTVDRLIDTEAQVPVA
jgi:hypothetical protein